MESQASEARAPTLAAFSPASPGREAVEFGSADEIVAASQDVGLLVIASRGRRARKAVILPPGTSAPELQATRESDHGATS